jgi:D-3-phosphoglycerate dehydrogenase
MPAYQVIACPCDYDNLGIEQSLLEAAGATLTRSYAESPETLIHEIEDADALLVQYTQMTEDILARLRKCQVIVRYGTGYDNFDLAAATEHGIYAANVPDYCKDEVATHALALLLSLVRRIVQYNEDAKRGVWDAHSQRPIHNLREQVVGIVGFGRIGRTFSKLVKPLFGSVLACDPYIDPSIFEEYGVERADLHTTLRTSDVVSLHVLLTYEPTAQYDQPTYHLIGQKELEMMKPSVYLVNTARGGVVDDRALRKALTDGQIAGAGLDVIENAPESRDGSELVVRYGDLLTSGKLILTHHVAYLSEESLRRTHRIVAEEVVRVLQGGEPRALLNPEVRKKARAALR